MVASINIDKSNSGRLEAATPVESSPAWKMIVVASIAAGVQFGWALQLSLLTPYVQLLGVPHKWAAFIWLCGPISGIVVQPIIGYYSDRCTSRFGPRRPFIAGGTLFVAVAVFCIGFAADIGRNLGDSLENGTKARAVVFFVIGFWVLDVANNMLQGPCRALLADLAAGDQSKTRAANSFYSFFMAVGNVLGYAAGSNSSLYKVFPFTKTDACDLYCANLKSCFFISIALLLIVAIAAFMIVKEEPLSSMPKPANTGDEEPRGFALFGAFKKLKKPMWILMLVTCLNWIGWFPFLLFDTDWMGKEVYGGQVGEKVYDMGVRAGALGLMLNSVVLGVASLAVEVTARVVGGVKILWGAVNFLLAVCLFMTILVTKMAEKTRQYTTVGDHTEALPPLAAIKGGALAIFAVLGIPLAVTYSMPFALASIYSTNSGAGQGLSLGVLNLSICIPQMVVSVVSGPLDAAFGGGNLPAFVMGGVAAVASGLLSIFFLPNPPQNVSI